MSALRSCSTTIAAANIEMLDFRGPSGEFRAN
jgi:hypothetical protein